MSSAQLFFVALFCLGLLLVAVLSVRRTGDAARRNPETADESPEREFFEKIESGKQKMLFLGIAYPVDLMMIKSLLRGAAVPYYVEFERFNRLYGGALAAGGSSTNVRLYILRDDFEKALPVISDFISQKAVSLKDKTLDSGAVRALSAAAALLAAVPPAARSQQILGIRVYFPSPRTGKSPVKK